MTTQMKLFTNDDFKALYGKLHADDGLMTVLSRMQKAYGIHERKTYENADTMIRLVAAHENTANMLSDDALEVLDAFLSDSEILGGCDRKVLLQQLFFGLNLYQDEVLLEKMKEGTSENQLFRDYITRCSEDPTITEEVLEDNIRKLMGNYCISPKAMRQIVKEMEKNQALRATATELGEEGMRFKAVVAMDLYLRSNGSMSMEEAVHIACTNIEMQAVADGVSQGLITEEKAKKIFLVIILLCILAAIWLTYDINFLTDIIAYTRSNVMFHEDYHLLNIWREEKKMKIMFKESLLLGGCGFSLISDKIAEWMGQFAAKRTFVRTAEETNTAIAMENIISRMENDVVEAVAVQNDVHEEQTEVQKQAAKAYI